MNELKLVATLLVVLIGTVACVRATVSVEDDTEWHEYKSKYGKWYETSETEATRYKIWKAHSELVDKHNKQADEGIFSFWLAMNEFADLSNREFVRTHNGFNNTMRRMRTYKPKSIFKRRKHNQVPDAIDWRDHGYVTEVKNQGMCGSCWAFSSTGALEGQHMKSTGQLVSLSEQNLVDCSGKYGNQGCNGGLMDQAFAYVKENNGIDTEESYPYTAHNQQCKFNPNAVGATDSGFVDVKTKDEKALKQAIGSIGPISVAIDASHITFQLYSHGVYHEFLCSSTRLDHGVLAVGYGTLKGKDYWIVKNSWGEKWGDKGYILMSRNRKNNCGIATAASYPLI